MFTGKNAHTTLELRMSEEGEVVVWNDSGVIVARTGPFEDDRVREMVERFLRVASARRITAAREVLR